MLVTIDIPEPLYRDLEAEARAGHQSVPELIVKKASGTGNAGMEAVESTGQRVKLPLITGGGPGPLLLQDHKLNDIIFMTEEEIEELARS